ncbi:MAG TPA: DUF401 family protein [Phycisphaerales bacterium]|nr:DUF401 family protein [Phycisphaerales bacterium]
MYALGVIAVSLTLLVGLLRLRVKLGRSMLASALLLALLLGVTPAAFWTTLASEWRDKSLAQRTPYMFVMLSALLTMVNVLGVAMRETGVSMKLGSALHGLFRSRRVALAVIPMLMGMLPTPGGIMLSAPMVRDLGDYVGVSRDRQAAINFHFRHLWEPVWPLFPAVPLVQGMLGLSAATLVVHNLALSVAGLVGGTVFMLLARMPARAAAAVNHARFGHNLRDVVHAFWPIALVAGLYAGLDVPPAVGVLLAVVIFLAGHRVSARRWAAVFAEGLEFDYVLLIFGALLFKLGLEAGGAVGDVVQFLNAMHVPSYVLIFALPMLVAYLTGVTTGTIAISFPFLIPYIGTGLEAKAGLQTLAFAGVLCGLLITPVHLCLALSAGYFQTTLARILLWMIGPVLCVAGAGALMAALSG